jgi:hypothetical protein
VFSPGIFVSSTKLVDWGFSSGIFVSSTKLGVRWCSPGIFASSIKLEDWGFHLVFLFPLQN